MPSQPTGKPPGRPRKDGTPPQPKVKKAPEVHPNVKQEAAQHKPFELAPICTECWPDGWPEGWTGIGCPHGIWARRV